MPGPPHWQWSAQRVQKTLQAARPATQEETDLDWLITPLQGSLAELLGLVEGLAPAPAEGQSVQAGSFNTASNLGQKKLVSKGLATFHNGDWGTCLAAKHYMN